MSQEELQEPAASPIRFDRAEFGESSTATSCALCSEPLAGSYFEINGAVACPPCRAKVGTLAARGSAVGRFLRALAGGLAAAVLGAGIYYAVLAITNYEIGLIAIVVGFLVGRAVQWGSHGRGGWLYQGLAMALTYVAIVSTYVPFLFKAAQEQETPAAATATAASAATNTASGADTTTPAAATAAAPAANQSAAPAKAAATGQAGDAAPGAMSLGELVIGLGTMAGIILALPFLAGFENFVGWLIIGFAVYQAWKMNRKRELVVTGPFRLAPTPPAAVPA